MYYIVKLETAVLNQNNGLYKWNEEYLTGYYNSLSDVNKYVKKRLNYYRQAYGQDCVNLVGYTSIPLTKNEGYFLVNTLYNGDINDEKPNLEFFGIFNDGKKMIEVIEEYIKENYSDTDDPKQLFLITPQPLNEKGIYFKNFD